MASNVDVSFAWLLADLVGAQARHPDERDRIESALQAARLPLTTVALAGCILARLPHDFERRWLTYHAHGYVLSVVVAALWLAQRAMDDSPYNLRSWIEVVANNAITRDMLHTTDAMMLDDLDFAVLRHRDERAIAAAVSVVRTADGAPCSWFDVLDVIERARRRGAINTQRSLRGDRLARIEPAGRFRADDASTIRWRMRRTTITARA